MGRTRCGCTLYDEDHVPTDAKQVLAAKRKPPCPNRKGSGYWGFPHTGDRISAVARYFSAIIEITPV